LSPLAQKLFDVFKNAYNPDKRRFKDRGWRETFRRSVAEYAHDLKKEMPQSRSSEGLMGAFWRSVKEVMPLEVAYSKYSSVGQTLRKIADELLHF